MSQPQDGSVTSSSAAAAAEVPSAAGWYHIRFVHH